MTIVHPTELIKQKWYCTLLPLFHSTHKGNEIIVPQGAIVKVDYIFKGHEYVSLINHTGGLYSKDIKFSELQGKLRDVYKNEHKHHRGIS